MGSARQHQADNVAVADPRGEHHHRGDHHDARRRSEIRLGEDQPDHQTEHHADRHQRIADVVDPVHAPFEQRRHEDDDRDLGQLRRLHAEPGKPQPPRRAVEARAEQHSHERRADDGERRPDDRRLPVVPVVDAHDDRQDRKPHQRPGDLFDQEEVRRLELLHRHHGRRAVDHDDAGTHEQQRGREEQLVRFELSRHTPPFNGHLKRSAAAADNLSCDPDVRRSTCVRVADVRPAQLRVSNQR